MNIVILKGNLTRDPESRQIPSGVTVTNFGLAVNRKFTRKDGTKDEEVTFVDCMAWDTGGELIAKYCQKGDPLLVNGSLQQDTWEKDGVKHSRLRLRVNKFEFVGGRRDADSGGGQTQTSDTPEPVGVGVDDDGDPEVPF